MLSATDIESILRSARSEVKRWGGDSISLTHTAFVLRRRWPKEFVEIFGDDGHQTLSSLLKNRKYRGSEGDVRRILDAAESPDQVLREFRGLLDTDFVAETTPEPVSENPQPEVKTDVPATGVWPERSARFVNQVEPRGDLHDRAAAINELAVLIVRKSRPVAAVVGLPGSGRTALLAGVAHRLGSIVDAAPMFRISANSSGDHPSTALRKVLEDVDRDVILAIDDFDTMARLGGQAPDREFLSLVNAAARHPKVRLLVVCNDRYFSRIEAHAPELAVRIEQVSISGLAGQSLLQTVADLALDVAESYGVTIKESMLTHACEPPSSLDLLTHPGLAADRLDEACARAIVRGSKDVETQDFVAAGYQAHKAPLASELADRVRTRIKGQDSAVQLVSERLALTRSRLDLRPERPDGVFLFVGPTGVGKTELARELAQSLFGSRDQMIRLDMSEYAQEWAVSRLVGPMPGYVGSTEPETWLTTRVAAMPHCVLLLDEIEKAHRVVWNTFLQVFDAGRLTDSRGVTADFNSVVIVLTSNLGVAEASSSLGFGTAAASATVNTDRLMAVVRDRMPPELLGRVDEVIPFSPLSLESITDIAGHELREALAHLARSGWQVTCGPGVVEHLAAANYDPRYGARHLLRNLERLFLMPLAQQSERRVEVTIDESGLAFSPSTI